VRKWLALRRGRHRTQAGLPVLLGEVEAGVGVDGLAGDEVGLGQEDGDAGAFVDGADVAHGEAVGGEVGEPGEHVGGDECGGDGVDGDAFFGEEIGVGAGEAEDACFGGGIVRTDDAAILSGDGGEIDNASPSFGAHVGERALRDEKDGSEIDTDGLVPVGFGDLRGRKRAADAGVVDEDVDGAEGFFYFGEEAFDLAGFGDVGLDGDRAAAEFLDFVGHGFGSGRLFVEVYGDVGTFGG